ncbi:unnamed protein product [Ilex paraguariensis]|uniref:Uncharacterized protein n=1 Tax=Ilex paraguariensis TaxID=185542 RepID=A0ABC8T395_9AQUA
MGCRFQRRVETVWFVNSVVHGLLAQACTAKGSGPSQYWVSVLRHSPVHSPRLLLSGGFMSGPDSKQPKPKPHRSQLHRSSFTPSSSPLRFDRATPSLDLSLLKLHRSQLSLTEWLVASPGFNKGCSTNGSIEYNIGGGVVEFPGRVYPSRHGDFEVLAASSGHRESFSVDRPMILKVDRGEMEDTSFSRSQSGKIKKRVRFKLPEVADIFILDSSNNTHFEK